VLGVARGLERICAGAAALAALLLLLLFGLGLAEILVRNLGIGSLTFASELSGYLLAAILLLPLGHVMARGQHIRVALLLDKWPRFTWTLDFAATLFGLVIAALLAWALTDYAWVSAEQGARSYFATRTPLWLPQLALALGGWTLVLGLAARLLRLASEGRAP
jgi:TRAP-type C4-dicarboxylate transport system permease small subunit